MASRKKAHGSARTLGRAVAKPTRPAAVKAKLVRTAARAGSPSRGVDAVLAGHGLQVSAKELTRMIVVLVESLPKTPVLSATAHELTKAEQNALKRSGLDLVPHDLGADDPLARTTAEYAAIVQSSKTVAETARMLGVNESRVRQRLNATPRTLYGFKFDGEWRVPDFIFEHGALVPGMRLVAPKLDSEVSPVGFFRWFTTPNPDLVVPEGHEERLVSPRQWLVSGGRPADVAELAAGV